MNHRKRQSGAALLMVLVLLIVVVTVTSVLHANSLRVLDGNRVERERAATLWAAEGGVARAQLALRDDPRGFKGETLTVGSCTVVIRVVRSPQSPATFGVTADATASPSGGRAPPAHSRVQATLERRGNQLPAITAWSSR